MRRMRFPVRGHQEWEALTGSHVAFRWSDGYDPYQPVDGVLLEVQADSKSHMFYLRLDTPSGYGLHEAETVEVTVTRSGPQGDPA